MSSGSWVSTGADALTAVSAAAGAAIGGIWAYVRYLRQEPDVPRANATVSATLALRNDVDYLAVEVEFNHLSGSSLTVDRTVGHVPAIKVKRLTAVPEDGSLQAEPVCMVEVFPGDTVLSSGESARDHEVISAGRRSPDVVAYEVVLRVGATSKFGSWAWTANAVVQVDSPERAVGTSVAATPTQR